MGMCPKLSNDKINSTNQSQLLQGELTYCDQLEALDATDEESFNVTFVK